MAETLTARSVERLKPGPAQYDIWDELITGLGVRVAPSGTKTWTLRYRVGAQQRRLKIGRANVLTLADARRIAKDKLKEVDRGGDPAQVKADRRVADTFADLADSYITKHAMKRKRSWKVDKWMLDTKVTPLWKHRPVREITRRDVRDLIAGIADGGAPIQANRAVALLSKVFKFAIDEEMVDASPAVGITRPGVEHQRDRVLTDDEIRQFWTACGTLDPAMGAAFKLRLLTAARSEEVFSMRWSDVDLAGGWWTIPSEHAKNKLPHRVPLSQPAKDILTTLRDAVDAQLKARKDKGKDAKEPTFVLEGARGKRQRAAAAREFKLADFVGHDLRRTAATRMASAGITRFVVGKLLNHTEPGVTKVYDRASYDAEKRTAIETLAREVDRILKDKPADNVVPMRGRA